MPGDVHVNSDISSRERRKKKKRRRNIFKAHFNPAEPRNEKGEWMSGMRALRRLAAHVDTTQGGWITIPRAANANEQKKAADWAHTNLLPKEEKYAGLIIRLAGKGKSQDPRYRGEMSKKYDIELKRMTEIEHAVYGEMWPTPKKGESNNGVLHEGLTRAQRHSLMEHGARKVYPEAKSERPSQLFKATKGEHRGKYVKMHHNGAVSPVSDAEAQQHMEASKAYWKPAAIRARLTRITNGQRDQINAARAALDIAHNQHVESVHQKRMIAAKWAKEHGLDPADSYWHAFFWNDPSLLQSDNPNDEGLKFQERHIVGPIKHQPKTSREKRKIDLKSPEMDQRKWRGHRPGPRRAMPGDGEDVPKRIGRYLAKRHFNPLELRDYHGRWSLGGGRARRSLAGVGEPSKVETTTRRASGAAASVWDHKTKGLAEGVKLKRLPHQGVHLLTDSSGRSLARKKYTPEQALYHRNNGPTKITDKRLAELHKDRSLASQQEKDLLLSAAAQEHLDGSNPVMVYTVRDKTVKPRPRYSVIANLRKELANDVERNKGGERGVGGHVRRRSDISDTYRDKENQKRQDNGRNNYAAVRKQVVQDFAINDKGDTLCIFCHKKVAASVLSPERMKPGPIGGKYERGNVAPAHEKCNTKVGGHAQHDPQGYYEEAMRKFMLLYGNLPPDAQKRLGFVFAKHRKYLGTRPR